MAGAIRCRVTTKSSNMESVIDKIKIIRRHFRRTDPIIFPVLAAMDIEPLRATSGPAGYFAKLCREIISQQLGSKAARAILDRFLGLFPRRRVIPAHVLALSEEKLRATGMSWAKARYIHDLADKTAAGIIQYRAFGRADNEAVIAELTKIKGIGRWTAEMFLIFTLGREDVFSFGDLGLRKGFTQLYGARCARTQKHMAAIIQRWSPYRSYASLALWHINDSKN